MPSVDTEAAQETLSVLEKTFRSFSWLQTAMLVCLLVACVAAVKIILKLADKAMDRARIDRGVHTFLLSGLKVILWLMAICVLLGYLGVPMTSLVALLSVLGLAISLAVQGTLSNLAGGIMLLTARPFSSGDFVEAGGVSGTVHEVGLVYTKINTPDNKVVYVPNGDISAKTIINYTAEPKRRVELKFSVSYDASVETVKAAISKAVEEHPLVLQDEEQLVRVDSYGDSSLQYLMRCWCATGDYWTVYFDLNEAVKTELDRAGAEMSYPHVNVHMMEK